MDRLSLDSCGIVADPAEPSYVRHAVRELTEYLRELTGKPARQDDNAAVTIFIGSTDGSADAGDLGAEGFRLRCTIRRGKPCVTVAGNGPMGTRHGIGRLMRLIQVDENGAFVDGSLDVVSKPAFAKRGMHFNGWAFRRPYSFRAWTEDDWKRYLDTLALQGVNLFFLWPFMEIMPLPLSAQDEAYLQECRRVVEYAQTRHGMEVWLMQCTNRVARDNCGVADPRLRPYWRPSQEDLNPARPEHFAAIMDSRAAMYRIIDNADGICNIDSDPGACPDSPLTEYVKVLQGCRALLDRHNPRAKMIHWMWFGWGQFKGMVPEEQQTKTIRLLKQHLSEPWQLICGLPQYLPICRQENVLHKTVLLPYNYIEGEPSYPFTNVSLDEIRSLRTILADNPELAGLMGNVQTPWLQLPHMDYFLNGAWDPSRLDRTERDVLLDVASSLYPQRRELIADCYAGVTATDAPRIEQLVTELAAAIEQQKLGHPGAFARKQPAEPEFVARSLVMQLKLRAAQARLMQALNGQTTRAACEPLLENLFDAYLAWDLAHGWHELWDPTRWPMGNLPSYPQFAQAMARLGALLGDPPAVTDFLQGIADRLAGRYDAHTLEKSCVEPMAAFLAAKPPEKAIP